jgi:hypothetical protein
MAAITARQTSLVEEPKVKTNKNPNLRLDVDSVELPMGQMQILLLLEKCPARRLLATRLGPPLGPLRDDHPAHPAHLVVKVWRERVLRDVPVGRQPQQPLSMCWPTRAIMLPVVKKV